MTRKVRHPPSRSRRLYSRRQPLPEATRRCGRVGVAQAKSALERDDGDMLVGEAEQLMLDLEPTGAPDGDSRG